MSSSQVSGFRCICKVLSGSVDLCRLVKSEAVRDVIGIHILFNEYPLAAFFCHNIVSNVLWIEQLNSNNCNINNIHNRHTHLTAIKNLGFAK